MLKPEAFADAARSLVGTPFVAEGRDQLIGVDCAGMVIVALQMCGEKPADETYSLIPGADLIDKVTACLKTRFHQIEDPGELPNDLLVGDVMVMRGRFFYNHLSVYIGHSQMVHAIQGKSGKKRSPIRQPATGVVVSPIDHGVCEKIHSVWRLIENL